MTLEYLPGILNAEQAGTLVKVAKLLLGSTYSVNEYRGASSGSEKII